MNQQSFQRLLAKIPPKWALTIVGLCLVYALVQPIANRQLGWSLPSISRALGITDRKHSGATSPTAGSDRSAQQVDEQTSSTETEETSASRATESDSNNSSPRPENSAKAKRIPTSQSSPSAEAKNDASKQLPQSTATGSQARQDKKSQTEPNSPIQSGKLLYGILKDTGRENYISVKGLRYGPGSEEGHRLKHLERHLADIPSRPGKHGVFEGDMAQTLAWIDDAYDRAARGAKGIRKQQEGTRSVLEVPFDKQIGYIGGRDGARSNHPPSKRLRLVIEGNRFITAFPF